MAQRIEDEEYHPLGEHVVEIPARHHAAASAPKRSFAALGVAAFLTLAGVTIVVGIVQEHAARERDDRAAREDAREGWQTLSSIAAEGAANDAAMRTAANQPSAPPTVVVVPVQVSPPATPIAVSQPLPGSTAQAASPQTASVNAPSGAFTNGSPASVVPAPVPVNAPPSAGVAATPPGTAASAPPPAPVGATPASNPAQPIGPTEPFPATQSCGIASCDLGSVCCNARCGICTPPGVSCSQVQCG